MVAFKFNINGEFRRDENNIQGENSAMLMKANIGDIKARMLLHLQILQHLE
jgi:hypothetical protein